MLDKFQLLLNLNQNYVLKDSGIARQTMLEAAVA
jgi:hypothetical protein